jgi:starch synthase (maltosyl-transferring)
MISFKGKQRVIISHVSPEVENGRFPSKAAVEEPVVISAVIICDGHDELSASIYLRNTREKKWMELPMVQQVNDRWEATFVPGKTGRYEFRLEAWVDHYKTWQNALVKKQADGQDLAVELKIGADLMARTPGPANNKIKPWQAMLTKPADVAQAVALATSEAVLAEMYKWRDPEMITAYPLTLTIDVERKKAAYSSWYELFPRSAAKQHDTHGTFNDVIALLPRIAKMGFDVLYLPPIHPIGEKNRKGKNNTLKALDTDPGSPWAIGSRLGGHKSVHPQLGSLADFKTLINEARKINIEVALDIAFQCAPDHPYVKEHPQWFNWRPDGTVQYAENPPKKYEDILPFNFETDDWENLWAELKSVIDFWISAGVAIFRIDNPHTKSFRFWEWLIAEVRQAHPEIIFLAEAFTRPRLMERLAKAGFNQSYSYFTWRTGKKELEEYITELAKTDMRYFFRPNFWPNTPDILPPVLTKGGENAHLMRVILAATLSSNYGIYGPVYEFGINQPQGTKEEYIDNEKYEIKRWDWNATTRIGEVITRVNRIRRQNPALQSTWNIELAETSNEQILCFAKTDTRTGNTLVVAVNLDVNQTQSAYIKIPFEKLGITVPETYRVHDLLSGESYRWQGEWNYVQLNPYQMPAHILKFETL